MDYKQAIMQVVSNKGIEKRGRVFRAYVHEDGMKVNLGTYDKYDDARRAVCDYWVDRFERHIFLECMNPFDGVVIFDNYVLYPNGRLFNLKGNELHYDAGPGGRPYTVTLNGHQRSIKKIYESVFGEWRL